MQTLILKYLNDYAELLSTYALIAQTFPDEVLETLRGTNSLIYLANSYCLTMQLKKELSENLKIYLPRLNSGDKNIHKMEGYVYMKEIETIKKLCL